MSGHINFISCPNPAMISRLNVSKNKGVCPVTDNFTTTERRLARISQSSLDWGPIVSYDIVTRYMGTRELRKMTSLLACHEPDELGMRFYDNMKNLVDMFQDAEPMGSELEMGVVEGVNDEHYEDNVMVITHKSAKSIDEEGESDDGSGDDNNETPRQTFTPPNDNQGQDYSSRHKNNGPFRVARSTQFAQLVDPTGKAISQQSTVIDNIMRQCSDRMAEWKQTNSDTIVIDARMKRLLVMTQIKGAVSEEERKDTESFIYEYGEMQKSRIARMEIFCSHLEGLCSLMWSAEAMRSGRSCVREVTSQCEQQPVAGKAKGILMHL